MKRKIFLAFFLLGMPSCAEIASETPSGSTTPTVVSGSAQPPQNGGCNPARCDNWWHCSELITRESRAIENSEGDKGHHQMCSRLYHGWQRYWQAESEKIK